MGVFQAVLVVVKTAFRPGGAVVAGVGRPVSSGTPEGNVLWVAGCTLPGMYTSAVITAFKRHLTFVGKSLVQLNLFIDSGFVFADGLCNGGF